MAKKGSVLNKLNKLKAGFQKKPEGIVVLSAVSYLLALVFFLFSASSFFYADVVGTVPANELLNQGISTQPSQILLLGIFYLFLSGVFYVIGRGLFNLQNRSRVGALVVVIAFLIMMISASIRQDIFLKYTLLFVIIVGGVIIRYLTKQDIVKLFK